jgi:hypothetical protein
MSEKLFIYSWFFGGFAVAFISLFITTIVAIFGQPSRSLRWFCAIVTLCGLTYEGGCFAAASSFGRATGGGDDGTLNNILGYGVSIAIIWSVVIISIVSAKENKKNSKEKSPKADPRIS